MKKLLGLVCILACLIGSTAFGSTVYTFSATSSAASADFRALVMKMNNTMANDTETKQKPWFVWDEAVGLSFTKTTSITVTGLIRVFAVGVDVKVYKGSDLTNYWLIKSNTSDILHTR